MTPCNRQGFLSWGLGALTLVSFAVVCFSFEKVDDILVDLLEHSVIHCLYALVGMPFNLGFFPFMNLLMAVFTSSNMIGELISRRMVRLTGQTWTYMFSLLLFASFWCVIFMAHGHGNFLLVLDGGATSEEADSQTLTQPPQKP